MYKCENCGETFDEPRVYYERHGFDDFPETLSCCPYCGGGYTGVDHNGEEVDEEE